MTITFTHFDLSSFILGVVTGVALLFALSVSMARKNRAAK